MKTSDKETVENIVKTIKDRIDECWDNGFGSMENGEVDSFSDHILSAYNREIEAKDAENASLRALVKELADALETIDKSVEFDPYIGGKWTIDDDVFMLLHTGNIVAKAQEVVK